MSITLRKKKARIMMSFFYQVGGFKFYIFKQHALISDILKSLTYLTLISPFGVYLKKTSPSATKFMYKYAYFNLINKCV